MKVLITGSNGFLGKNLIEKLVARMDIEICHYDSRNSKLLLERNLRECDFLFHFAAVHRPIDSREFYYVNDDFFKQILDKLEEYNNKCPVLLTSSIQASDNNDYGRSKKIAEELLRNHGRNMDSRVIIYRLYNTFGKWARPDAHSVVATFCYHISHDLPIVISNRNIVMKFYYIDDVINSFISNMENPKINDLDSFEYLPDEQLFSITLGELADTLYYFHDCDLKGEKPEINDKISEYLLKTYSSYKG